MGKLIYAINTSLDGYVEDANGSTDWSEPSEEVHSFFNELQRATGICLYGRRMYEVMAVWESDEMFEGAFAEQGAELNDVAREYAEIWRATEKIVFSRTLAEVTTGRTRLEREFDPEMVRRLKQESQGDLAIAGPELAAEALRHGLVDEIKLVLAPVVIGGGKRVLPADLRLDLELVDERRFADGAVYLSYACV